MFTRWMHGWTLPSGRTLLLSSPLCTALKPFVPAEGLLKRQVQTLLLPGVSFRKGVRPCVSSAISTAEVNYSLCARLRTRLTLTTVSLTMIIILYWQFLEDGQADVAAVWPAHTGYLFFVRKRRPSQGFYPFFRWWFYLWIAAINLRMNLRF